MSLRNLLLVALLAVSAAAQSSNVYDVFMSVHLNMTAERLCAVDNPSRCFYIPRIDLNIDQSKTHAVVTYRCGTATCAVLNHIGDYQLLRYIVASTVPRWYIINVPRPGLLYAETSFRIGPPGSGDGGKVSATSYTVCGRTYRYAYYAAPGTYNITPLPVPLYLLDIERCVAYRIAAGDVVNITSGWYSLYLAELYPPARRIYYDTSLSAYVLNGTLHAYLTYFHAFLNPPGRGFYILGPYAAPTLVMPLFISGAFRSYRGPISYDVWSNYWLSGGSPGSMYIHYSIGWPPGDGFFIAVLLGAVAQGQAELAYVAENSTGYFMMRPISAVGGGYALFSKRYDVVHVAFKDVLYVYDTRGITCPIANYGVGWALNRLDRVYEIEICNNRTDIVYVALSAEGMIPLDRMGSFFNPGYYVFMYGDVIPPHKCARLRWDPTVPAARPYLRVYTSPQNLCRNTGHIISTQSYNPGWRYNLVGNSLVPVGPISPDYNYAPTWLDLLKYLSQLYNSTLADLLKQLNRTQTSATTPFNLTSLFSGRQFLGTIKMDAATSTWLRTTLSELQKWQAVGTAPTFGAVSLPTVPAAIAPAAAAAVAVAWAASRRDDDVATTAAVAGVALALFGILMTLIYGTESLTLVALGVIVAAAAVAWRRIS
jgi:hypothetical protein